MNDVISVIIPVYNVAQYLPECLDSILSQDYEALEILLIDDGSKDNSGEICDSYGEKDARIRVIHQKNAGAAAAKNAGLAVATGEYLSFADSDDYLEPGAYRHMHDLLVQYHGDVVQCGFRYCYQSHSEDFVLHKATTTLDAVTYLKRFPSDWTCALLWNKLYRRGLYKNIFFPVGHRIDDEFFTYRGILNAKTIVCDDRIVYNYRRRASSVMHAPEAAEQRMFDRIDCMNLRRKEVAFRYPELKWEFDFGFMDALIYLSQERENTPKTIARLKKELKAYLKDGSNTPPPRYLWLPFLKLALSGTNRLLTQAADADPADSQTDYFV